MVRMHMSSTYSLSEHFTVQKVITVLSSLLLYLPHRGRAAMITGSGGTGEDKRIIGDTETLNTMILLGRLTCSVRHKYCMQREKRETRIFARVNVDLDL